MLIQKYDSRWVRDFSQIKSRLQDALNGLNVSVEHIGSTAVPGLAAKPIIDIDMVFENDLIFSEMKDRLSHIGYFHNGDQGIRGREVFKRKSGNRFPVLDEIKHHLYACRSDSEELRRHLLFRDLLRKEERAREAYEQLKYFIAEEANQDRKIYADMKEIKAKSFINRKIALASGASKIS